MPFTGATVTAVSACGVPMSQAGVAAVVASTSRQVGAALGVAVIGSALNSGLGSRPVGAGFLAASSPAGWIVVGCGLSVLALGLVSSGRWARSSAERTAHLFHEDGTVLDVRPALTTLGVG